MKTKFTKICTIFILIILLVSTIGFVYADENEEENSLDITAEAAILIDNKTNKILYSKNEDKKMYPASTTKILTAIITIENSNLDDVVTASYDAIMSIPEGYSSANIQVGEDLTVEQLLEMLLVPSANDAASVLAEYIGGSSDSFVSMMNTKLNELNLTNTHFTNSFGMHDDDHYTTASDMAKLLQYCLKNDTFRKIAGSASCAIPATNKSEKRLYASTNELLISTNRNYYQYLMTGKTGYTSQAKECLVSSAYKDNLELIGIILGSSQRFKDTRDLYNYGYDNYLMKTIINENDVGTQITVSNGTKDTKNLDLLVEKSVSALIAKADENNDWNPEITLNEKISAPITENDVLGKIEYEIDGIKYSSNLIASHNVEKSMTLTYALYAAGAIILILLIYKVFFAKKKVKVYKY